MKRRILFQAILVMVLLLLLAAGLSQAQQPDTADSEPLAVAAAIGTAFTYQGQLVYNGAPVNDSCDFTFSLWDAAGSSEPPAGGTQINSDITMAGVTVGDGLFTVSLDFGSDTFTGDARWLEIAVDCGSISGTLSPRQALTPAPYALALPGLWTQQHATSPNLIGGYSGNSVSSGVFAATISGGGISDYTNRVTDDYGTVSGGRNNQAGDDEGTTENAGYATVGGGGGNIANSNAATVGGGGVNTASGGHATIGGGGVNTASGAYATIGGGRNNTTGDNYATISGGYNNTASGYLATICGGYSNTASGDSSTVIGGRSNVAQDFYSLAAGRRAKANHQGAFVWADSTDADFASTANDQFLVRASGGVNLTVAGGALRLEPDATSPNLIGGYSGNSVTAGANSVTIGGGGESGFSNRVTDDNGTVGGGRNNQAGDDAGTTEDAWGATVGGGGGNTASGERSTVSGGDGNTASGDRSTVPGGQNNTAQGDYSFAAGRRAKANTQGAFVWADSTDADFASTANNQFLVRASGGVGFSTSGASFQVDSNNVWHEGNDGSGSTLDADLLDGQHASAFWSLSGNAGTTPGTDFLGTTDNADLVFITNSVEGMRLDTDGNLNVKGDLEVEGSIITRVTSVSTSTTLTVDQSGVILVDNDATITPDVNITLPNAAAAQGVTFTIKRINTGTVAVNRAGSSTTIDGVNKRLLVAQYDFISVISDGANWFIISQ